MKLSHLQAVLVIFVLGVVEIGGLAWLIAAYTGPDGFVTWIGIHIALFIVWVAIHTVFFTVGYVAYHIRRFYYFLTGW